jgi:AcrR family transcriptional regulator
MARRPRADVGVTADVSAVPIGGAEHEDDTKYARTRGRILDAAAYVLSRKGYAGTRLSDVAQRADIQTPAIYYYFASRDDLIEEVMASGLADMREHLQAALRALPPDTPALDKILVAAETHLRHELEISDYTTASIRNQGQIPAGSAPAPPAKGTVTGRCGGNCSTRPPARDSYVPTSIRGLLKCSCLGPLTGQPSGGTHTARRCTPSWPTLGGSSGARSSRPNPTCRELCLFLILC